MKIFVEITGYIKDRNRWFSVCHSEKEEISEKLYLELTNEKHPLKRRTFKNLPSYGKMVVKLNCIEKYFKETKNVFEFTFED
nr:MAG TPA: hypothetical protein [Caudoviricetes sp.]